MNKAEAHTNKISATKQALILIDELQSKIDALENARKEPIAVIGMGCRFPGGANNPDSFWRLLHNGEDAITDIPSFRWHIDQLYDENAETPGKMYTRQGGFLEGVDKFDAEFFGVSPRETASTDPQQRLLLEVSWEALESAGVVPGHLINSDTGVFVGVMNDDYAKLLVKSRQTGAVGPYFSPGNHFSFVVGRLSYTLGLHGPSVALDTACSSSLTAVHLACQSLRLGESSLALAGGVNLNLSPELAVGMCQIKALSPDGRCKTFDASADGFGQSEGCGMVVLKRLSDAVKDGDNILALIRGSAVNHDGPSGGLTVPNGVAQEAMLRKALANAGVKPSQVSYVETHGTGTSLGDPIEVGALAATFGANDGEREPLILGSVKSNIGHAESAAGVAGLIKVVLSMLKEEIPPNVHFQEVNPHIAFDKINVNIPTKPVAWPAGNRIAGVSAFGLNGTNAHIILAEAPSKQPVAQEKDRPAYILTLSAKNGAALKELAAGYERYLSEASEVSLADLAFTTNVGRSHFAHRLAIAGDSVAQARERLQASIASASRQSAGISVGYAQSGNPKAVFMFTGQGAQYPGMARELYETEPVFKAALLECHNFLQPHLEKPLLSVLYGDSEIAALINQTAYTQPALFAIEYALGKLWMSWGVKPDVVLGHSIGEYVAAYFAGVFSLEDGLKLIAARGRLMQSLPQNGKMAAVFADEERVAAAISDYSNSVSIATANGPNNIVIAGLGEDIEKILNELAGDGIKTRELNVSHAFHSPLMEPILDEFEKIAGQVEFKAPAIPLISNVTGERFAPGEIPDAAYWRRHIRATVRFADGLTSLYDSGHRLFLEVGPDPILVGMGMRVFVDSDIAWITSLRRANSDVQQILQSLGQLYVQGVDIAWKDFYALEAKNRRRIMLPTYPFQRQRYWFTDALSDQGERPVPDAADGPMLHPLLGRRLDSPLAQIQFETAFSNHYPAYACDYKIYGKTVLSGSSLIEMALAAGHHAFDARCEVENFVVQDPLLLKNEAGRVVQVIVSPENDGKASLKVAGLVQGNEWQILAEGALRFGQETQAPKAKVMSVEELEPAGKKELPLDDFYASVQEIGLQYGPAFRAIEKMWQGGDNEFIGRIKLPDLDYITGLDNYSIHPVLLEAGLQLAMAALPSLVEKEDVSAYLLTGIDRISVYRDSASLIWARATAKSKNNGSPAGFSVNLHLQDEQGQAVAEIAGLHFERKPLHAWRQSFRGDCGDWLFGLEWEEQQSEIAGIETSVASDEHWLIFADKGGIAGGLCALLVDRGAEITQVFAGEKYASNSDGNIEIAPQQPADFQRLVDGIVESGKAIQGVVYLWGLDSEDFDRTSQAHLCGGLLHLAQALAGNEKVEATNLWLATRGLQPAGNKVATLSMAQAPLWGLGRTISLEHPEMPCICIDLDPQGESDDASSLFNELFSHSQERQVAFRDGKRYVARLCQEAFPETVATVPLESNATYLITGGFRGPGFKVAQWLVSEGARHLVLVARSQPSQETQAAIAELERIGARVLVARGDVSKEADVARILSDIKESMPRLAGIIHAAGVLDNDALTQQTWEGFERIFAARVQGAWNLHKLTLEKPLDFFVLFSSINSALGSAGQANYMAANTFLDILAVHRRDSGMRALSIHWGAWEETGMMASLDDQERDAWARKGIGSFTPNEAVELFAKLLLYPGAQVVVTPVNWLDYMASLATAGERKFFANFKQEDKASDEATESISRESLMAMTPKNRRSALERYLQTQLSMVLGYVNRDIDVTQPFDRMGLDSLMAVQLRNKIVSHLEGVDIQAARFLQDHNIVALTQMILEELSTDAAVAGEEPKENRGQEQLPARDSADLLANIDQLSDEEVELLLQQNIEEQEN